MSLSSIFVYIIVFDHLCCHIFQWFETQKTHTLVIDFSPYTKDNKVYVKCENFIMVKIKDILILT